MISAVSDILVVLVLGGGLSWLSQRLRFPNAVAQVVLGVLLGTAVLGWVPHSPVLHEFGAVGVVLLLGVAGLELGLGRLTAAGPTGAFVATLGIVFSVVGGYGIGILYGSAGDEALYLGLALGATSIGITVQLLEQFGLIGHRVADILVAAAVIDDVIALYLLGAAHGFLSEASLESWDMLCWPSLCWAACSRFVDC
jgi:Kef-type K+ transport system membrane component KefB